jgi:hypothetical protein
MSFALIVAKGRGRGRRYRFDSGVSFGRDAANDVVLNQAAVSRVHARIERQGQGWALLDRGSANGTQLNGAPVAGRAQLREGDRIGLAGVLFEFRAGRSGARAGARWRRLPGHLRATFIAGAVLLVGLIGERAVGDVAPAAMPGDAVPQAVSPPPLAEMASSPPERRPGVEAARAAWERGQRKLRERRIAPGNLYDAWRAFGEARDRVTALASRPEFAGDLEQRVADAQRALEGECRRLRFTASRFERYGETDKAQQTWREILLHFPGDDPGGCHREAQDNLVSPQPDDADG